MENNNALSSTITDRLEDEAFLESTASASPSQPCGFHRAARGFAVRACGRHHGADAEPRFPFSQAELFTLYRHRRIAGDDAIPASFLVRLAGGRNTTS